MYVRDRAALAGLDIGVKALGVTPQQAASLFRIERYCRKALDERRRSRSRTDLRSDRGDIDVPCPRALECRVVDSAADRFSDIGVESDAIFHAIALRSRDDDAIGPRPVTEVSDLAATASNIATQARSRGAARHPARSRAARCRPPIRQSVAFTHHIREASTRASHHLVPCPPALTLHRNRNSYS